VPLPPRAARDRALYWNKTHGAWSVVVMRMDGLPGLDVRASIGLRFGFLTSAGAGLLALGALAIAYVPYARRRRAVVEGRQARRRRESR
jgi:hypothetical protein